MLNVCLNRWKPDFTQGGSAVGHAAAGSAVGEPAASDASRLSGASAGTTKAARLRTIINAEKKTRPSVAAMAACIEIAAATHQRRVRRGQTKIA